MAARRVYLSSTFVDLKDFREKVLERLRRAQSVVVAMEDYAAFDERPADKCLADVASCDVYIGVLGRRYGYVPQDDNPERLSISEMEYRRAGNPGPGKPPLKRLMFQLDQSADWPNEFCDANTGDNEAGARIDRFRAEVSARHGIRTFRAPEELAGLVLESLLAMLQPESAWRWPPIWDFGAYMAHKGKDFVGRDWLFRDIDDWLAKPAPRALLIRADFGVGKSAIMSELIKRNPGGAIVGWHFCQHDTQDTLAPATFVRNLASQLAAALPAYRTLLEAEPALKDKLDRAGDDPASAFEAAIAGPLGRIAPPGGARLLIVDALDEALEVDAATAQRHGNLIRLLANKAGRLPDWLRLLVTSRSNPEVIRPLSTFGLKEIDAENVANQSDLRGYARLRCMREPLAGRLREASRSGDEIADILRDKSLGKFLYTIRALDDLENGNIAPDDLAALPPGMDSFYLDAFERRFARAGRDYAQARDLLGVLALAREPLPAATLAEILGQPASALQAVRRLLPDFIRLRGELWAFDHFSLAEWLTGLDDDGFARAGDHAIDVEASGKRFHAWALNRVSQQTAQDSPYLVRHLAAHLIDDDERRRVFAKLMLTSYEWIAERLRLRGVDALIADCKHLGDLAEAPLLRALFRSSAHVLRRYPDQLPAQLLGRIRSLADPTCPLADLLAATKLWVDQRPANTRHPMLLPATGSLRISASQIARFEGHTGAVRALVVLADGCIASGSDDCTVRIWDPDVMRETRVLRGHTGSVTTLISLGDGRIASGSDDCTVRVWTTGDMREACVFDGHTGPIRALMSLADGRIASGSDDCSVRIWAFEPAREAHILEGHTDSVRALAALADGRIASGSEDCTLRVWDPDRSRDSRVIETRGGAITVLVPLPDGRIAFGSDYGTVRTCDPDNPSEKRIHEGRALSLWALVQLADGRLAFADDDALRIWDPDSESGARAITGLAGNSAWIRTLVALADGRLAYGSADGSLRIWNPSSASETNVLEGHTSPVTALVQLADGRLVSGSAHGTIRVWDLECAEEIDSSHKGHAGPIYDLVSLSDGRLASGSGDCAVRVWDPDSACDSSVLTGHMDMVTTLAPLAGGRLASRSFDGTLRIWDLDTLLETCAYDSNAGLEDALVALADRRIAFGLSDHSIGILDPDRMLVPLILEGHTKSVTALMPLCDGRLVSGSDDGTVRVWDSHGLIDVRVFEGHTATVRSLVQLPDGRVASGSHDGTVRVWSLEGGRDNKVLDCRSVPIWSLVSLAGQLLAAGLHNGSICIWDYTHLGEARIIEGHTLAVRTLAALPDGRLVSGSDDGTLRMWDATSGREFALFVADGDIASIVACAPDLIAAGDATGAVHFLKLHP